MSNLVVTPDRKAQREIYNGIKTNTDMLRQTVARGIITGQNLAEFEREDILADIVDEFKTCDSATQKVKDNAVKLAAREECVLITGDSGTGKELLAHILHGTRQGNFIDVNTCAITDTLFESELFGHVRGAFTGADRDRDGLIKQTEGEKVGQHGTLFLDEIGDMPLHLQPKLLRMIQNRTYRRVGDNKFQPVKCRIVAATHQDLPTLVKEGKFRLDLYERLNVFALRIPPLCERPCDIPLHTTPELCQHITSLVDGLPKYLSGNVRQLCNLKLRAEVLGMESVGKEDVL